MNFAAYPYKARFLHIYSKGLAVNTAATVLTLNPTVTSPIMFNWEDMGSGKQLTKIVTEGTATGTFLVRSSASQPPNTNFNTPIDPSPDWHSLSFDPASGSLPSPWTHNGSISFVNGKMRNTAPSAGYGAYTPYAYNVINVTGKHVILKYRVTPINGSGDQHLLAVLGMGTGIYGGYSVVLFGIVCDGTTTSIVRGVAPIKTFASGYNVSHDLRADLRTTAATIRPTVAELYHRLAADTESEESLENYEFIGYIPVTGGDDYSRIYLGAYWSGASTMDFGKVLIFVGEGLVSLSPGQNVSSLTADQQKEVTRRFVQVTSGTIANGTITKLLMQTSTSNPAAPTTVTLKADTAGVLTAKWSAVTGCSYIVEWHNGTSVVQSDYTERNEAAFDPGAPGTYTVRVRSLSADNVESLVYSESAAVATPAAAPSVSVAVSPTSLEPGDTSYGVFAISGGAAVTVNGSNISNGQTVALAEALEGAPGLVDFVTNPADPEPGETVYGQANITGNAVAKINGVSVTNGQSVALATAQAAEGTEPPTLNGTFQLVKPPSIIYGLTKDGTNMFVIPPVASWGSGVAGTVSLWQSNTIDGTFTEVPNSEVNYADLTFNVAIGNVNYAKPNSWPNPNASKYYKAIYTNSSGFTVHTAIVSGSAEADYEISVQFNGLDRAPAGSKVKAWISKAVKYGTTVYETGTYEATVEGGQALLTGLPRLAKTGFTDLAGGTTKLYATIRLPDGSEANYILPDAGAINFASLAPHTGETV